jgi:hypothetical protein
MKHVSRTLKDGIVGSQIADILICENDVRVGFVMLQVPQAPAHQVINHVDPEALLDQQVHDMAADKSRATRYHRDRLSNTHCS